MKNFYFLCVSFFSFLTILNAAELQKSGCLEKEKALALLETAKDVLTKVENTFPSCTENVNSEEQTECSATKPLAYVDIAKKLISDVRENFPTCQKVIVPYSKHRDCSEIAASGQTQSGLYSIWPREPYTIGKEVQVYCDLQTDGGRWTVIQRRGKFAVQQDFYQDWETYENGFGNITEEFWLGNENIRLLCQEGCEIRFDLKDKEANHSFAVYRNFSLTGSNYTLHISDYEGNAGDTMQYHNSLDFSTKDKGATARAQLYSGGWWYDPTNLYSNLNGVYMPGQYDLKSVHWWMWRNYNNLASVEIKVRPK